MQERKAPTTIKVAALIQAHKDDPNAHHVPVGGADVKSGTKACASGANSVTFGTAFASTPQVVVTHQDASLNIRDALLVIRAVSTTGFDPDVDAACTVAWIATDAGNP